MAERYVYLAALAESLNHERSTFKRRLLKQGVTVHTIRNPTTGQENDALTAEDAKRVIAMEPPAQDIEIVRPEDLLGKE